MIRHVKPYILHNVQGSLINSNSVHFGPRTGLPDKMFKGDDQRIILAKLESNWPNSLRGKKIKISSTFSVFSNSGHVGWMSGLPDTILKGVKCLERITLTARDKVVADRGYNTESLTVDHSGLNGIKFYHRRSWHGIPSPF